jgi:hypothetical protein
VALCDEILDEDFVHKDIVWHPDRLIAGPHAFKKFVEEVRAQRPAARCGPGRVALAAPFAD